MKEYINKLEEIIKEHMTGARDDYIDGVMDGLLIAIKVLEDEQFQGQSKGKKN